MPSPETTTIGGGTCGVRTQNGPAEAEPFHRGVACAALPSDEDRDADIVPERGSVNDWSKLDIRGGVIHYRVYQQDGSMQPMTAPDTIHNRQVISWIQIHDRM